MTVVLKPSAIESIPALYRSGLSGAQIGRRLGVHRDTILYQLKRMNIPRRESSLAHSLVAQSYCAVPMSFGLFPLTPAKAWVIGVLYGDGNITGRGHSVRLAVHSSDVDIVDNVNNVFGGRNTIYHYNGYPHLYVNSVWVWNELHHVYGFTPNKFATLKFPALDAEMLPHFVRGLLDSDGTWTIWPNRQRRPTLRFQYCCCAPGFVEELRTALIAAVGVSSHSNVQYIVPRRKSRSPQARLVYSKHDARRLGKWMYQNSDATMRSQRKYDRFVSFHGPSDGKSADGRSVHQIPLAVESCLEIG